MLSFLMGCLFALPVLSYEAQVWFWLNPIHLFFLLLCHWSFIFHWWLLVPLLRPLLIVVVYLISCVWLFCDPMGCSPPGSSDPGIFEARVLKWVAISFPSRSYQVIDWTHFSSIDRWILDHWAAWEALGRNKHFPINFFSPYSFIHING